MESQCPLLCSAPSTKVLYTVHSWLGTMQAGQVGKGNKWGAIPHTMLALSTECLEGEGH
jgi:hypothetical protein